MNVTKVNLVSASTFLSLMFSRWASSEQAPLTNTERLYRTIITAVLILNTTRDVKRTAAINALTTGTTVVGMIHWTKMMKKHQFNQHVPASQIATGESKANILFQWRYYCTAYLRKNYHLSMYFDKQARCLHIAEMPTRAMSL